MNGNRNNERDWGKIIIRIALLLFIIFFISRWFAKTEDSDLQITEGTTSEVTEAQSGSSADFDTADTSVQVFDEQEPDEQMTVDQKPDTTSTALADDTVDTGDADDIDDAGDHDADTSENIDTSEDTETSSYIEYRFRNRKLLDKHYDKHGIEMGFDSAAEYEAAACAVANNPKALHKLEQEDGDDVYYIEDTGEFVVVSTDGFIRTYYYADKAYFDRQ